jgi:cyclopropane fatty-acyl-phospholipid synthase-like methyltransferase
MSNFTPFLNPFEWFRAYQYHRTIVKFDKSQYDLELFLYSKILKNNMLHYGYFEDPDIKPEDISLKMLEDAQENYANNIIKQVRDVENTVLDVGCGMGGLAQMMHDQNLKVEVLTPNKNQIEYINQNQPYLTSHNCRFEDYQGNDKVGTVINSESLQYIPLLDAFAILDKILLPGGRWVIVDYFRIKDNGINKSSHLLADFIAQVDTNDWKVVYEQDITANTLPTLKFANMYLERFVLPIKHFFYEKLRFKRAWLYYLTERLRGSIEKKFAKEQASIDPTKFGLEKKYMLFVLEKINK